MQRAFAGAGRSIRSAARSAASAVRRNPVLFVGIIIVVAAVAAAALGLVQRFRSRRDPEGLKLREYERKDYPKDYKPQADRSVDVYKAAKEGKGDAKKAAKWALWSVSSQCLGGTYVKEILADKKYNEFTQDSLTKLCVDFHNRSKKASEQQVANKEYVDCNPAGGWCDAPGASKLGYWCKHPTDPEKCCKRNDGKGCTKRDKLRDSGAATAATSAPAAANAASYPTDKKVTVYHDQDFSGRNKDFGIGEYSNMKDHGFNDGISSLKVPQGLKVEAWEHADYKGRTITFYNNDHSNLKLFSIADASNPWKGRDSCAKNDIDGGGCWNDMISSMKVSAA